MIEFDRMFQMSKNYIKKKMENREIEVSILPTLKKQEKNVNIGKLVDETAGYILIGEGGIGKTSLLLSYLEKMCGFNLENSGIIPIYIKVNELQNSMKYKHKTIIEYILKNYLGNNDVEDLNNLRNSFIKEIEDELQKYKVVLLIDGINEIHDSIDREKIWKEIECFIGGTNIKLILTSQFYEQRVPEEIGIIKVNKLDIKQVNNYLKSKEIKFTQKVYMNNLFYNPMFLKLYVEGYRKDSNSEESKILETKVLQNFFEMQLRQHADSKTIFIFKILLPIMCYQSFVDKKNLWEREGVIQNLRKALDICFDNRFVLEFIEHEIEASRDEFMQYDVDNWLITIITFCSKNLKILENEDEFIGWSHELFYTWFVCRGLILSIKGGIKNEEVICEYIAETIDLNSEEKYDMLKLCEYFYVEHFHNIKKEHMTKGYIRFLVKFVYLYDELRKDKEALKLAVEVLTYLEEEYVLKAFDDKVELASHINGTAYALVHLRGIETRKMLEIINYAKTKFDLALSMIYDDNSESALRKRAQIYGNIGAYYITLHKLSIKMAKESHEEALKIRDDLLKTEHDEELIESKAISCTCIATDYFYMGDYAKAIEYHEKAIGLRINENKKVVNYNRVVGAISYEALHHPYKANEKTEKVLQYLGESIEMIKKWKEYGELSAWCKSFEHAMDLISILELEEKEKYIAQMKKLLIEYKEIYERIYLYDENFLTDFNKKIESLNLESIG